MWIWILIDPDSSEFVGFVRNQAAGKNNPQKRKKMPNVLLVHADNDLLRATGVCGAGSNPLVGEMTVCRLLIDCSCINVVCAVFSYSLNL